MVAAVLVLLSPVPHDDQVVSFLGAIHPDQCNRGLELSLSKWVDSRVRRAQNNNGNPRRIRASCDPEKRSCVALLEGLGFEPVRYFHRMCVTLQESVHEPTLPSQVHLASWDLSRSSQALEAFNNAFTGHWGLPILTQEMWDKTIVGVPQFRPDLSLMAMSGSGVIGVCVNWVLPIAEGSRHPQGWIEAIGVIPEWRGRGVADAMMARTLNDFSRTGELRPHWLWIRRTCLARSSGIHCFRPLTLRVPTSYVVISAVRDGAFLLASSAILQQGEIMILQGVVESGIGNFGTWIALLQDHYKRKTGMLLFPGTLNIRLKQAFELPEDCCRLEAEEYDGAVSVNIVPCTIFGREAVILRTDKTDSGDGEHPREIVEIATDIGLRARYGLRDGDVVSITVGE